MLSELTAMLIVLIVSHPVALDAVSIIVPAAVNVWPRKLNGSSLAQIVALTVFVLSGLTATLIVLIVSHPVALETVSIIVPAAVNVWPRNE